MPPSPNGILVPNAASPAGLLFRCWRHRGPADDVNQFTRPIVILEPLAHASGSTTPVFIRAFS
jgi:hypothetical protein